jgi:hypothetical protein
VNSRIYAVADGTSTRLVRAASVKQAVKHCAQQYEARIPSMEEYGELLMAGVRVEEVTRDKGETT